MYSVWTGKDSTFVLASSCYDDAAREFNRLAREGQMFLAVYCLPDGPMPPSCPYALRIYDASGAQRVRRDYADEDRALRDAKRARGDRVVVTRYDGEVVYECNRAST